MKNIQCNDMAGIMFDYARTARIGLPEAVFCERKPFETLLRLLDKFSGGTPPILFTRLKKGVFERLPEKLKDAYDYDALSRTAYASVFPARDKGKVAIVTGGAADSSVASEAARTLTYLGIKNTMFEDCGIAGLWRLTDNLQRINEHDAIIVVAGMEGALPGVVAGLSPRPVFALPTSVGYGVAKDGKTALEGMLASCAPGVAVLNIDNGYGAACAAARTINLL